MDLEEIRKKLDKVDFEILKLLNGRMELALLTRKFKKDISNSEEETSSPFSGKLTAEYFRR